MALTIADKIVRFIITFCVAVTTIVFFTLSPDFLKRVEERGLFYLNEDGFTSDSGTLGVLIMLWVFIFILWKKDSARQQKVKD